MKIGTKIRELRAKEKLSLDDLAQASGVSKAYLSQLENGDSERPSAEILYNIAAALNTSIADLLGRTIQQHEPEKIEVPIQLQKAALKFKIEKEMVNRLASLQMRDGKKPKEYSEEDWHYLHETLKRIDANE